MSEAEQRVRDLMRRLPWRDRLRLRLNWAVQRCLRLIPGYNVLSALLWKVGRQGFSALWTPAFNIKEQDYTQFDKRLRWHGWGVLAEDDHFRAHTPRRQSASLFGSPNAAWSALADAYWGKSPEGAWEPRHDRLVRSP